MNILDINKYLPHRYPFLLIDKVLNFETGKKLTAIKNVTINEPFFSGHFPGNPIMPGVLIIEALAQAAAILAYHSLKELTNSPLAPLFYLGSIDKTRFKKLVIPGDQLLLKIEITAHKSTIWKFNGQALVDSQVACVTEVTCAEGEKRI